jgi:hypothetical protein
MSQSRIWSSINLEFKLRSREIKLERFPSCGGMVPTIKMLLERLRYCNLVREPMKFGMMEK